MRIGEHWLLLAVSVLASLAVATRGDAFLPSSPRAAFAKRTLVSASQNGEPAMPRSLHSQMLSMRGGATVVAEDDDEEESEDEEKEEEEEVDEVVELDDDEDEEEEDSKALDASLAAAALKSTKKSKAKAQLSKTSAVKKSMNAKLSAPKKKKGSLFKFLRVPYIVRACLNPLTVMSMTKHFWLSLVNLDYPPKVSSLNQICRFLCVLCVPCVILSGETDESKRLTRVVSSQRSITITGCLAGFTIGLGRQGTQGRSFQQPVAR